MSIAIPIEPMAGGDIDGSIIEMIDLANRTQVRVQGNINGVRVVAQPNNTPALLLEAFWRELKSAKKFKFAMIGQEQENAFKAREASLGQIVSDDSKE
jgi:hypothetical protein